MTQFFSSVCVCTCVYIYINYIERERDTEIYAHDMIGATTFLSQIVSTGSCGQGNPGAAVWAVVPGLGGTTSVPLGDWALYAPAIGTSGEWETGQQSHHSFCRT